MILIDKEGTKYRAVKKDNEYYLILEYLDKNTKKIEVKGKNNVMTYIKKNKLVKYDYDEEKIRKELVDLSWWMK